MYNSYTVRKQTMDLKNGTHENQHELFHGTKYDSVKSINVQGFNRSLCGQNGELGIRLSVYFLFLSLFDR